MCVNPSFVWVQCGPKWEQQPVACRQCWRCRRNRVNDYVGRAMCEMSTSVDTCVITLTYAPRDDFADKLIDPRHFQLFIKRLRRVGHKVRYMVAGELGDLKGRAHFHAILFFSAFAPQKTDEAPCYGAVNVPFSRLAPQKEMCHIREWPHGHVKCDWAADQRAMRYVCKYLLSENKNNVWFSLSKKPTIGAEFFARKALKARELGVLPSKFEYVPPGGDVDRPMLMTGATRRDYLNAITVDGGDRSRMSDWVGKTFDKHARQRHQDALDAVPIDVADAAVDDYKAHLRQQWWIERKHKRNANWARAMAHIDAGLGPYRLTGTDNGW